MKDSIVILAVAAVLMSAPADASPDSLQSGCQDAYNGYGFEEESGKRICACVVAASSEDDEPELIEIFLNNAEATGRTKTILEDCNLVA